MIITKKVLISDIILRVTQGKPSAELELEQQQVAFMLDQVRWSMVIDKLNKQIQSNYSIDPVYITTDDGLTPIIVTKFGAPVQDNIQIQLKYNPLSLWRDRGVIRIFAVPVQPTNMLPSLQFPIDYGSPLDMISASEMDDLRNLRFSKPSLSNLKFRREGRNIYILGLDQDTYQMVNFSVTYVPRISILEDLNDNDPVPLTEDLYGPLVDAATKTVYQQIYSSGADIRADAVQNPGPVQVNK